MTAMSNAERQRRYRERQRANGLYPVTMLLTDDEAFRLQRVLKTMRDLNAVPAMVRDNKGRLKPVDL
jgi:hypothetical protein